MMTSYTTPSPYVVSSSGNQNPSLIAWYAFNDNSDAG
jgi:hypothetical protein